MEVPSVKRVLAAYSPFGDAWVKFVEWVQKKYPNQKFHLSSRSIGRDTVQDIVAGSKVVASATMAPGGSWNGYASTYSVGMVGDTNHISWVVNRATAMPSFEDMRAALEKTLAGSPVLLGMLNAKDAHPDYAAQLRTAWAGVVPALKTVITIPLEVSNGGHLEAADAWLRVDIADADDARSSAIPLLISLKYKARKFEVSSFGVKFVAGTFPAFLTLLSKIPFIVKKGLASLPPHESAMLTGKVSPDAVVSRIVGVKARFETIDEWQDTDLEITLMLTTGKPVSTRLLSQWVFDHWREVLAAAPSKTPPPSKGRGRSDEYDEPEFGLLWIVPNKMPRPALSEIHASQDGKRAVVTVNAATR